MDSVELLPEEFWFYRVYLELTLALLHQVNNELTGALFLTELIQDDVETGSPIGEKPSDLEISIRKVIHLNEQITNPHFADPPDSAEPALDLGLILQKTLPMLRLLLPKTVILRIDELPAHSPEISLPQKEIQLVFAAVGLLLCPTSSRAAGRLTISFESTPTTLVFLPNYLASGLIAQAATHPGFLALQHRMRRLGGEIEIYQNPALATHSGLRLVLVS